jgi:hypothetical protein
MAPVTSTVVSPGMAVLLPVPRMLLCLSYMPWYSTEGLRPPTDRPARHERFGVATGRCPWVRSLPDGCAWVDS